MNNLECSRCALCCTDTIVPLNDYDVRKITRGTGMPADQVVRFFSHDDVEWPRDSNDWVELRQGPRLMALRKRGIYCWFLRNKRCAIYDYRPRPCRTFPVETSFDKDDLDDVDIEMQGFIKKCTARRSPVPDKSSKVVRLSRALFKSDLAYQKKVQRWNETNPRGTIREFLEFMKL